MVKGSHWKRDRALWVEFVLITAIAIPLGQWSPVSDAVHEYLQGRRGDVYPALVGLEGTILGFIVAALTIVLGYANSPRFEVLRATKHWESIFRSYTRAAKWTGLALMYGIITLLVDTDDSPNSPLTLMLLLSGLLASIRVSRMLYITEKVVKVVVNVQPRAAGE